jgi:hypothetical protein
MKSIESAPRLIGREQPSGLCDNLVQHRRMVWLPYAYRAQEKVTDRQATVRLQTESEIQPGAVRWPWMDSAELRGWAHQSVRGLKGSLPRGRSERNDRRLRDQVRFRPAAGITHHTCGKTGAGMN